MADKKIEPMRRCPQCRGSYEGKGIELVLPSMSARYCSSDCLLDAYERETGRAGPARRERIKLRRKAQQ